MVRAVGLEPTHLAITDFESVASTIPPRPHWWGFNWPFARRQRPEAKGRGFDVPATGSATVLRPNLTRLGTEAVGYRHLFVTHAEPCSPQREDILHLTTSFTMLASATSASGDTVFQSILPQNPRPVI